MQSIFTLPTVRLAETHCTLCMQERHIYAAVHAEKRQLCNCACRKDTIMHLYVRERHNYAPVHAKKAYSRSCACRKDTIMQLHMQ
jgi:hypothetical protein